MFFVVSYNAKLAAQHQPLPSYAYEWKKIPVEKTQEGERRAFLDGTTKTLEHFEIYATTFSSDKVEPKSEHNKDIGKLILVKEGQLGLVINDFEKVLSPGSIALVAAGDEHKIFSTGSERTSYYTIQWKSTIPTDKDREGAEAGSAFMEYKDMKFEENSKGGRRNVMQRPTATLNELEMHITTLSEGMTSHAPHTHTDEEIIIILKGEVEEMINGSPYHLGTGSVIFLSSMDPHGIRNAGKGECEYYAIRWVSKDGKSQQ